jgi:hypothetical protein
MFYFNINMNNKNYCVFIYKKNLVMNVVSNQVLRKIYLSGTLFEGEIVKTEKNKYIFLVNDLPYFKGEVSYNRKHLITVIIY